MNMGRNIIVLVLSTFSILFVCDSAFSDALESLMVWEKMIPDTLEGKAVLEDKNWEQDWQELGVYQTKDNRTFLKPERMKIVEDDLGNIAPGKAKIVVFRKKNIFILRYRLSINQYAFVDFSAKSCFTLQVPANKPLEIGSTLIDEVGIDYNPQSVSVTADEGSIYYYEFKPGWRKVSIVPISELRAQEYFQNGYKPQTVSFEIDWDAFEGHVKDPFDTRSLDAEGYTSVWPNPKYTVYKPYR